jgi:hypothetical protein
MKAVPKGDFRESDLERLTVVISILINYLNGLTHPFSHCCQPSVAAFPTTLTSFNVCRQERDKLVLQNNAFAALITVSTAVAVVAAQLSGMLVISVRNTAKSSSLCCWNVDQE